MAKTVKLVTSNDFSELFTLEKTLRVKLKSTSLRLFRLAKFKLSKTPKLSTVSLSLSMVLELAWLH